MAETKTYRIETETGIRYLKLADDGAKAWRKRADDKTSPVVSITAAEPEPINAAPSGGSSRRSSSS